MQMLIRVGAVNGLSVVQVSVEIQYLRFPMIDPNHGMKVFAHDLTISLSRRQSRLTRRGQSLRSARAKAGAAIRALRFDMRAISLRQMSSNQYVTERNERYRTNSGDRVQCESRHFPAQSNGGGRISSLTPQRRCAQSTGRAIRAANHAQGSWAWDSADSTTNRSWR